MYPEVSLIDPEGKKLLSFKQDSMNPKNEGFVKLWSVTSSTTKQFIFKKRLSSQKAIEQWNYLSKHGWKSIEEEIAA